MDKDSIERIRTATFGVARRGYDKRQVDRFLEQLADWLETGGGDDARSEVVRTELERIGEQTGGILLAAHDASEALRAERGGGPPAGARRGPAVLERAACRGRRLLRAHPHRGRRVRDRDPRRGRFIRGPHQNEANAEAATTREDADAYAETTRAHADEDAAESIRAAEAKAHQMTEDATRRKGEIEKLIDDLAERRKTVLERHAATLQPARRDGHRA